MPASTAESLYEIAKQLLRARGSASSRNRPRPRPCSRCDVGAACQGDSRGLDTRTSRRASDLDPPRFTVRTARGAVVVQVAPRLLDAVRDTWGRDAMVGVDDVVDKNGTEHEAITIEAALMADDPLAILESTFGTDSDM